MLNGAHSSLGNVPATEQPASSMKLWKNNRFGEKYSLAVELHPYWKYQSMLKVKIFCNGHNFISFRSGTIRAIRKDSPACQFGSFTDFVCSQEANICVHLVRLVKFFTGRIDSKLLAIGKWNPGKLSFKSMDCRSRAGSGVDNDRKCVVFVLYEFLTEIHEYNSSTYLEIKHKLTAIRV